MRTSKDKIAMSLVIKPYETIENIDGTPIDAKEVFNTAILLLGNTGKYKRTKLRAGKSTLGNWLFGFQGDDPNATFKTEFSMEPVTRECQAGLIRINETTYNLIDTPTVFNNLGLRDIRNYDVLKKIAETILVCSYGIQAVIFVVVIKAYLGDKILENAIVAFTNLSKKQTENLQFPETLNQEMRDLLAFFDNRWFISPNPELYKKDSKVVLDNMKKAKELIDGFKSAYTTAMFNEIREADNREAAARKAANNGCFKLDTKVMLINKKVVPMSSVRIGDRVCCGTIDGKLKFSEVYSIAHRSFEITNEFLKVEFMTIDGTRSKYNLIAIVILLSNISLISFHITTEGSLYLTPEHHIFVNNNFDYAKNLKKFHTIQVLVNTRLIQAYVMNCSREYHKGYVAVFTRSGTIIADNVLCSCYAVCPPYQGIIHLSLFPLRLFPKFEYTIIGSNSEEIHPYLYFLMRLYHIFKRLFEFIDISSCNDNSHCKISLPSKTYCSQTYMHESIKDYTSRKDNVK
ncbi:4036_t:CDS:2 [Dentiscutata heterogama]|uniref:4036_t:CDS:1 n=1 Tax=Dentiscutata heterogama TaxID=1316150 RepID=A0ACA9KRP5_9GLOM|nr:4036_t:CDS:2 [Dentiscutata heterogama]